MATSPTALLNTTAAITTRSAANSRFCKRGAASTDPLRSSTVSFAQHRLREVGCYEEDKMLFTEVEVTGGGRTAALQATSRSSHRKDKTHRPGPIPLVFSTELHLFKSPHGLRWRQA